MGKMSTSTPCKAGFANTDPTEKRGTLVIRAAEGTVATPDRFDISLAEGESCECSFRIEKREPPFRVSVNLLSFDLCLNGIRSTLEAGFPDARAFTAAYG